MAKSHGESASSDDDGYKGVDLISESDGSEPDVEAAEARNIIDSEEDNTDVGGIKIPPPSPHPSVTSDWEGFDLDDGPFSADLELLHDPFPHLNPYFNNELELFNASAALDQDDAVTAPESKRVRFRDDVVMSSDSSCSTSSDGDEHGFPDLFMQQDLLDPQFRRMIENEQDNDDNGSGSTDGEGSYWDLRGSDDAREDEPAVINRHHPQWLSRTPEEFDRHVLDHGPEGSSSGYETDEGETTDEDLPPPQAIARTRSVLRRPSTSSLSPDDSNSAHKFRKSLNPSSARRLGPSLGSWIADPSKPIAVIDSTGKRMIIYRAQRPARSNIIPFPSGTSTMNTSPQTPHATLVDDSDNGVVDFTGHLYQPSSAFSGANLMMGGLLHGAPGSEFLLGGQVLGPPEAFYPFRSVGPDGRVLDPDENDEEDDDDDDEQMLNVNDFIDFGDGSSCDENDDRDEDLATIASTSDGDMTSPSNWNPPSVPDTAASSQSMVTAQSLLDHFDRGVVTSFRRNQNRHKMLLKSPVRNSQISMDAPTVHGSAIKGGRYAAANSPITPRRKRKTSLGSMPPPSGFGQPSAFTINGHKRRKSGLV